MIFEKTAEIIANYKEIDAATIKAETTLSELGLDSLDTVELAMSLEDEFGVTLEMTEELKNVGDLVKAIEKAKA